MAGDALFRFVQQLQGSRPWGPVLDAGTGSHSLEWMTGLETTNWTAVTGESSLRGKLEDSFRSRMRPEDQIVSGNWQDPLFLHGEVFSTVIADYLLGAIEGFAPYFQDRLFARLRPHVGSRLYYIGLGPYPDPTDDPWGRIIVEIARLRDACILLAGHRCYREYPLDWVLRSLEAAGYEIEEARVFPIHYGENFVREQLDVCRRKLPLFRDRALASQLGRSIDELGERALSLASHPSGAFGEDYVIAATVAGPVV